MIIGIVLAVVPILLIGVALRRVFGGHRPGQQHQGLSVRRFFQYLLQFGLVVVVATGLAGLIERALAQATIVERDAAGLARSVSFTLVGVPLLLLVTRWTRRTLAGSPLEAQAPAWSLYTTITTLTALGYTMTAGYQVLLWAFGVKPLQEAAAANLVVWVAVWFIHWRIDTTVTPAANARVHHLAGAAIALVTAATGLIGVIAASVDLIWRIDDKLIYAEGNAPLLRAVATFLVAAPVWFLYWTRTARRDARDPLWLGYVLLLGVGGGVATAVIAASIALYDTLVWFIGEPRAITAAAHFGAVPEAVGSVCIGLLVWWYHRTVLAHAATAERTEVRRIYEYLLGGVGLLSAAGGLTMVLVALVEALSRGTALVGGGVVNTLLAAGTLLVVGAPVWWLYWHRILAAAGTDPDGEHASPTRRIYLFLLFGVGGIVAIVTLLISVYLVFVGIFDGTFGSGTLHRMRYALALLVATGAVAGYHWTIYRGERGITPARAGARLVTLIGPDDEDFAEALHAATGARIAGWTRTDDAGGAWSLEAAANAVQAASGDVVLLCDRDGIHTIPVRRN